MVNMEQIVNIIVQNGLGVGSFIALLYFMFFGMKEIKEVLNSIKENISETSKTLVLVQNNLTSLEGRVETIENKVERNFDGKN